MSILIKSKLLIADPALPAIENGVVAIDGEHIVAVGDDALAMARADWEVVDCSDWTIMPGLIDAHVHITINNRFQVPLSAHFELDDATAVLRGVMNLRSDLASGVTTMRTLGDRLGVERAFKEAIERKEAVGPRLQICARALRPTHGTAPFLAYIADGVDELKLKIRENFAQGADWTKLFITNVRQGDTFEDYLRGDLTDVPAYSKKEIEAAIATSHELGLPVAAHAIGGEAMRWAMAAGIDSIEHANLLTEKDVALFVKSGAYLSDPNLQLFFDSEIGFESFGSWQWNWWRARVEYAREQTARYLPEAVRAGVKVCLGTDSTHATLWREARALVGLGVSEAETLKTITTHPAHLLGLSDKVGQLTPGFRADLIALKGNPLADIESLRHIRLVMQSGQVLTDAMQGAGHVFGDD